MVAVQADCTGEKGGVHELCHIVRVNERVDLHLLDVPDHRRLHVRTCGPHVTNDMCQLVRPVSLLVNPGRCDGVEEVKTACGEPR